MKLIRFKDDNFQDDMSVIVEEPSIIIRKNKKRHRTYLLFITLLIPMFIVLLYINNSRLENGKDIFKKYYQQENYLTKTRGTNDFYKAFIAFYHKDYSQSSNIFKKIYTNDTTNTTALFYYGLSNVENGNNIEAIKAFEYIINHGDNLYIEQSEWCIALCYVKMEQYEKATFKLKEIALDSNNFYYNQAFDVLVDIKKK